jgi:hypothetical protein
MQKPKSVEKTTIGNNAGQEYMAGKHKKRQSLDLHSLSVQVQQQHPLHSHMCKPKEDTFHQQNAKPKENRENIRVWVGGKKGQRRRRCKEELQKTKKPLTHTPICFESKFHNNNTHCIHSQKCTSRHT